MADILEIARVTVLQGQQDAFEDAVAGTSALFLRARGNRGFSVRRSIENDRSYIFLVQWETVEDHLVHFMGSDAFALFIEAVSVYFEGEPIIEHTEFVAG